MFTPLDILSLETWALLGVALLSIRYYIHSKWQVMKNLGIPHDPPSILDWGNLRPHFAKPELFFVKDWELMKKYGRVYGVYNGLHPRIGISDPDVLKKMMIKESHIFPDRQTNFSHVNGKVMGAGLTIVTGDRWKRIRHTLSPTFSTLKLKGMFGIVDQCTDLMVENLKSTADEKNGVIDTKEIFGKLSLDAVCSAAFGVNVHSQDKNEKEPKVVMMAKKVFDRSFVKNLMFFLFVLFPFTERIAGFFDYSIFARDSMEYFASLTDAVIRSKQKEKDSGKMDIMRSMLESEITEAESANATKGMTKIEITGNSVLMMMAGYETTSGAMIFLAYNLACYKEHQDLCREEIKAAIEKHGGLTYEAVDEMKYLMQCLNETMRLYPPAVRNSRECQKDITIDGISILKGMVVDIPTYGLGRDEQFWDEPLEFKPERMEDMNKVDPMVFQPFGAGPRMCIGMRFAVLEIKLAFSKLLLNFELDVCPDTPKPPAEIIFKFSTKPKEEIFLKVTPLSKEDGQH